MARPTLIALLTWITMYSSLLWTAPVTAQVSLSSQTEVQRLEQQVLSLRTMLLDQDRLISQLQHELRLLRGENEVLAHDIQQTKQQQQVIYLDLDNRLRQLAGENVLSSSPSTDTVTDLTTTAQTLPPAEVVSPPASPAFPAVSSPPPASNSATLSSMGEVELYQQGFNHVQTEQFNSAIGAFKQLLTVYPKGNYADNAQYWIAESYYALRQLDNALLAFNRLLEDFPNSAKRSHALLKIGYTYYEQRNYLSARASLERVLSEYPNSSTARLAQARLQKIQQMGY